MNMTRQLPFPFLRFALSVCSVALVGLVAMASASAQSLGGYPDLPGQGDTTSNSTVRQDVAPASDSSAPEQLRQATPANTDRSTLRAPQAVPIIALPPYTPNDFERFVNSLNIAPSAAPIRRFGS